MTANRVRAAIGAVFNWHANRDDDFSNPIAGMNSGGTRKRPGPVLSDDELRAIWSTREANPHPSAIVCAILVRHGVTSH